MSKRPPCEKGFACVYAIGEYRANRRQPVYIKLGLTTDVEKRLRSLQTANPRLLTLYRTSVQVRSGFAQRAERELHELFDAQRVKHSGLRPDSEWFLLSPEHLEAARTYFELCI